MTGTELKPVGSGEIVVEANWRKAYQRVWLDYQTEKAARQRADARVKKLEGEVAKLKLRVSER